MIFSSLHRSSRAFILFVMNDCQAAISASLGPSQSGYKIIKSFFPKSQHPQDVVFRAPCKRIPSTLAEGSFKTLMLSFLTLFSSTLFADDFIPSQEIIEPPKVVFESKYKSPFMSVGLSALFPGLGHLYLGDAKTAGAFAGTIGAAAGTIALSHSNGVQRDSFAVAQNTWLYGIYSSYRDVRLYNGNEGYAYAMPVDSLRDLIYAPFNVKVLKKPEVWGGVIGSIALAIGISYFAYSQEGAYLTSLSSNSSISPLIALPVGIGEEAFFRGYLQSRLAEEFTPWGGIAASSIAFGAAHLTNTSGMTRRERLRYCTFSIPLITTLGTYFGYLTNKNHSLKESVAVHAWYDFIIFSAAALATQSSSIKAPTTAAISFSF